jgi:ABC-type sugar transport system permease subunit
MSYGRVVKSGLLACLPVVFTLVVWIIFRSGNLLQLYPIGLLGGWIPSTNFEAALVWTIIWLMISIGLSFIFGGIYYTLIRKWHWKVLYFAILLPVMAASISLMAYMINLKSMVGATGELLIVAIGFGVFIPWFEQQNLRDYS